MFPPETLFQMQRERTDRARAGLAKGEFKFSAAGPGWLVTNGSGREFSVTYTSCTCKDFTERGLALGLRCKHMEAARILFPARTGDGQGSMRAVEKNKLPKGETSMYLGNLSIIGYLGRDPEMHFTPSGKPVTNFSVAVGRQYTGGNGEKVKETYWFKCTAWDKQAEICNQYLKKGSKVFIEGRLVAEPATGGPRIWNRQDGTPQASFELTVLTIKFLDGKAENSGENLAPIEEDIPF